MKILNTVLLSGILVALIVIVLQNAGLVLQPLREESGPVEVTGAVRISGTPTVEIDQGYGDSLEVKLDPLSPLSVDLAYLGGRELAWSESARAFGTVFIDKGTGKQFVEPIPLGRVAIEQESFDPPFRVEIDQGLPVTPVKVEVHR